MARTITILVAAVLATAASAMAQSEQAGAQAGASAQAQSGSTSAQTSANASTNANASGKQAENEAALPSGTALSAQLDQTVDSKKAKAGDAVTAKTVESVKANGKTVLPKGTKLVGHVTKAAARSKGDAESLLAVQFDHAILKGGQEIPLQASVEALAAAQNGTASTVSGDDLQPMRPSTGGGGMSGSGGRAGGAAGGATGAAGGVVNTVPRTAGEATGTVNSTVGGAANTSRGATGLGAGGQLTSSSRGVFGLEGLALAVNAGNSEEGSVITSTGKNVHLDSGTRILLVTQSATSVSAQR